MKLWGLGTRNFIRPSRSALHKILDATIRLNGAIMKTVCPDLAGDDYAFPIQTCLVAFLIVLPEGAEIRFEELTGYTLTEPEVASGV